MLAQEEKLYRIMLLGRSGVGKDAFANALWGLLSFTKYPPMKAGFADALKETVREMLNRDGVSPVPVAHHSKLTEEMKATLRPLWQWYGTEWVRNRVDVNYWLNVLEWRVRGHEGHVIITDARFPNEITWGKNNGFVIVRVIGPNYRAWDVPFHSSEMLSDQEQADYVVDNYGTEDKLHDKAVQLLRTLGWNEDEG